MKFFERARRASLQALNDLVNLSFRKSGMIVLVWKNPSPRPEVALQSIQLFNGELPDVLLHLYLLFQLYATQFHTDAVPHLK